MPSPPGAAAAGEAEALPPLREGALIGAGVVPGVVAAGAGVEELSSAGCIIFSVRGTWKASTARRITPPTPA